MAVSDHAIIVFSARATTLSHRRQHRPGSFANTRRLPRTPTFSSSLLKFFSFHKPEPTPHRRNNEIDSSTKVHGCKDIRSTPKFETNVSLSSSVTTHLWLHKNLVDDSDVRHHRRMQKFGLFFRVVEILVSRINPRFLHGGLGPRYHSFFRTGNRPFPSSPASSKIFRKHPNGFREPPTFSSSESLARFLSHTSQNSSYTAFDGITKQTPPMHISLLICRLCFIALTAVRAVQCSLGITDRGRHITASSPDRNTWMYKCPILPTPAPDPVSIVDRDGVSIYGFMKWPRRTWLADDHRRILGLPPSRRDACHTVAPPPTRVPHGGLGLRYDISRQDRRPFPSSPASSRFFSSQTPEARRSRALFFFLSHKS